jgi:hypothetical protein
MVSEILIFILAGFATGIITGLVGASAIVVFVPIILLFFNYHIFALIGISLIVDVFVSLFALIIYKKFHNINFKIGFYLSILAILGAVIGSYVSRFLPNTDLLGITALITAFTGIMIYRRKPNLKECTSSCKVSKSKFILAIILSFFVGLFGGGLGSAGGISIFLLLVFLLNFETHVAIGTSIFVMFFVAFFGSIGHIYYLNSINFKWIFLVLAVAGGIIGSFFSSKLANIVPEKNLNKIVGIILFALGILTFVNQIIL